MKPNLGKFFEKILKKAVFIAVIQQFFNTNMLENLKRTGKKGETK